MLKMKILTLCNMSNSLDDILLTDMSNPANIDISNPQEEEEVQVKREVITLEDGEHESAPNRTVIDNNREVIVVDDDEEDAEEHVSVIMDATHVQLGRASGFVTHNVQQSASQHHRSRFDNQRGRGWRGRGQRVRVAHPYAQHGHQNGGTGRSIERAAGVLMTAKYLCPGIPGKTEPHEYPAHEAITINKHTRVAMFNNMCPRCFRA